MYVIKFSIDFVSMEHSKYFKMSEADIYKRLHRTLFSSKFTPLASFGKTDRFLSVFLSKV